MPDLNHRDGVSSAKFSPDGRFIVTASLDGTARLWLADTLQPLPLNPILRDNQRLTDADFSPDARQIVTTGVDGVIRIWDLAGIATEPPVVPYGVSEDGSRFFVVTNNSVVFTDSLTEKPCGPSIHLTAPPQKIILSPGGRFAAIITQLPPSKTWHLQIWDLETAQPVGPDLPDPNSLCKIALSANGQYLLTFADNIVQSWDVINGTALSGPLLHHDAVYSSMFNPDGTKFATIIANQIEIRETLAGRLCFAPLIFSQPLHSAQFSPDGSRLVGSCWDPFYTKCYAQVWSANNGKAIGLPLIHGDGVLDASFSPDGNRVVTASEDFTATVWDSITGRRLISPVEHEEKVRTANFSLDGAWFVTASADKTARVWSAQTGDPLTPPLRHLTELTNAVFLPNGLRILTRDGNENSRIWPLAIDKRPVDDLIELSRLLSAHEETRFEKPAPGRSESVEAVWNRLRTKYPSTFKTSTNEIETWHEFQAEECDQKEQWFGEVFHLRALHVMRPRDVEITKKLDIATQHLKKGD
jgi:WD40 repeat protein